MKMRFIFLVFFTTSYVYCSFVDALLRVPKGFEELVQGQTILTDISLYGKSLGIFKSHVDLENIQFLQPEAIASAIYRIYPKSSHLEQLLEHELSKSFNRNGNLACSTNGESPGCDFLSTKKIDIIYDENNAKINLFIGKQYLPQKKTQQSNYYETNLESRNVLIHQQNINFVADKYYQSASLQGNGSLGVTDSGYLNIDWNWQKQRFLGLESTQHLSINNAYFRHDLLKKFYIQAGLMDSRDIFSNFGGNINLTQLPIGKIQGFRAGSTLAWRNIEKSTTTNSTPVSIFLSRDARVDTYRNEQLLASFYLKPGLQQLDVQSFPIGSYILTLQVYEDNHLVRTEKIPYTRLGSMSSLNIPQWFVQAGHPNTYPMYDTNHPDKTAFQAGYKLPITANSSVTAGTALFNSSSYWEGAIDWYHGFNSRWIDGLLSSRFSYFHGSEGSKGNIEQISYNSNIFSLSFFHNQIKGNACNINTVQNYIFNRCYSSTNLTFSLPFNQWNYSVSYSLNNNSIGYLLNSNQDNYVYLQDLVNDDIRKYYLLNRLSATTHYSIDQSWQAGITRAFTLNNISINSSLIAFKKKNNNFNYNDKGFFLALSFSESHKKSGAKRQIFSGNANWNIHKHINDDLYGRYNFSYAQYDDTNSENESGLSFNGINTDIITSSVYGRVGGQYGTASLTVNDTWNRMTEAGNQHTISSSGNYSSSIIVDPNGIILGRWGNGMPSSAITVAVKQPDQLKSNLTSISVSVENSDKNNIKGNSRALFTTPSYKEITFDVTESLTVPNGISSKITQGIGIQKAFMTPGKAFNRKVEVHTYYTWLGKFIDNNKRSLEGSIPLNVISWHDLSKGAFTIDTKKGIKNLYFMKDKNYWRCGMNVILVRDVIRYVGKTLCHKTELKNLPIAEKQEVKLISDRAK